MEERNIYTEHMQENGRIGGIASGITRANRASAKVFALSETFEEWNDLSLNQRNSLCKEVFGRGLGNRFLAQNSRGEAFLFNGIRTTHYHLTNEKKQRALMLASQATDRSKNKGE